MGDSESEDELPADAPPAFRDIGPSPRGDDLPPSPVLQQAFLMDHIESPQQGQVSDFVSSESSIPLPGANESQERDKSVESDQTADAAGSHMESLVQHMARPKSATVAGAEFGSTGEDEEIKDAIPILPSAPTGEARPSTRPTSVSATWTLAELTTEPRIPPAVASPLDLYTRTLPQLAHNTTLTLSEEEEGWKQRAPMCLELPLQLPTTEPEIAIKSARGTPRASSLSRVTPRSMTPRLTPRITPRSTNKVSPESTPRGGGADRLDGTALGVASLPPPTLGNAGIGFSVTPLLATLAPQGITTPQPSALYARPPVGLPLSPAWSDAADKEEAKEERAEAATERAAGAHDAAVAQHQDSANAQFVPGANLSARTSAQLPASPSPATLPLASEADLIGQDAEAEAGTTQSKVFALGNQVRVHDLPGHLERFNGKLGKIESVEVHAQGSQWLNVKLDDSVRVLPIRCPSTAATLVPYEENHDGFHVRESVQQGVRMEEHGGQLLPGEAVTVSELPMNLARYDGYAGHVVSCDHDSDEPRVWVKLEDEVRELPIRCKLSCVKRTKTSLLHAGLFDQSLKRQFMSDGEQIKVGKKSAGNLEDYADVMAHFKAEKLETIVEEDEKDMEEERNTKGREDDGEEKWDPTKQALWDKKILARRDDLILVSNLVRSLGRYQTTNVVVEEKKLTAAERVELEKEKMALEKQRLKDEAKAKRMAGPQPLIPGLVSNPDEFAFTFAMIIITVFSLWAIDIYNMLINNPVENDLAFHTTVLVCFIFFSLEFILYTVFKPGYVGSFFFYLDSMATISLLPDFLLLWGMEVFGDTGDSGGGDGDASGFARAGRAARAGTRAARIVRVFKAITLIKKSRQQGMKPPSLVGQLVNDGIQRKIIIIVAIMLVASELLTMILDESAFKETSTSFQHMLFHSQTLLAIAGGNVKTEPFASSMVITINDYNCRSYSDQKVACPSHCMIDKDSLGAMEETIDCDIRYLRINGKDVYGYGPSQRAWKFDLRSTPAQRNIIGVEGDRRCQGEQNWNASVLLEGGTEYERWVPDVGAWRKGFGAYTSTNPDLRNRSCLAYPCEDEQLADPCSMLILRTTLDTRKSSLASALTVVFVTILLGWSSSNFGTLTSKLVIVPLESMTAMVRGLMADPMAKMSLDEAGVSDGETQAIAGALIKLSTMLQIAFGEAGSDIITTNLNSGAEVNALIPGKRLQGVYGFCDIRSFTDCTECLQEDVMTFVNRIADSVHRSVSLNEGAPNKNVGDAFQLTWRLPERRIVGQPVTVADSALRAIIRILFETSTCPALYRLTSNTALQMRIPNYTTRFGFGLHAGWGIEGAIGSSLKIDPTYLSPNVKWSERLETATKVYGVLILMSDAFFDLLTPLVQKLCRKIDKIKVPDSKTPLDLYTYDTYAFDLNDTEMRFCSPFGNTFWEAFPPVTTDAWRRQFERALIPYSKGNWQEARVLMQACLEIVPDDKPGLHIMKVMEEHKFHAPPSWKGYRDADDV